MSDKTQVPASSVPGTEPESPPSLDTLVRVQLQVQPPAPSGEDCATVLRALPSGGFEWTSVPLSTLAPGHVVRVAARTPVPADLCLLLAASPDNTCYANMSFYDGDNTMQFRSPVRLPQLEGLKDVADVPELLPSSLGERLSAPPGLAFRVASRQEEKIDRWNVALCKEDGETVLRPVETKEILAAQSTVLLADWAVGVVLYVGPSTKFAVTGGKEGGEKRKEEKKAKEEKKKQEKERERKEKEALKPSPAQRAELFEKKTGIFWNPVWTDVPDDGNCLIEAFHRGLTTLLKHYPELRREEDKDLPESGEKLRAQFFARLKGDASFRQGIRNMFELFITGVDEAFLLGMEDFFTLPESIRERIISTKQANAIAAGGGGGAAQMTDDPALAALEDWQCGSCTVVNTGMEKVCSCCGTGRNQPAQATSVDFDSFVDEYIAAVTTPSIINGRKVYIPLGQSELNALARLYSVRLQTMTSEGVVASLNAVTIDEIDPRSIEERDINEFLPESQRGAAVQRIVRLLNVRRTHYYVHLPRARPGSFPAASVAPEFNTRQYWRRDNLIAADALPPLE